MRLWHRPGRLEKGGYAPLAQASPDSSGANPGSARASVKRACSQGSLHMLTPADGTDSLVDSKDSMNEAAALTASIRVHRRWNAAAAEALKYVGTESAFAPDSCLGIRPSLD